MLKRVFGGACLALATTMAVCQATNADEMAANGLKNIDVTASSGAEAGKVNPNSQFLAVKPGRTAVVGGFRSRDDCDTAPDFKELMESFVDDGLVVPDGLVLSDGGIGYYNSRSCNGKALARAINVTVAENVDPGTEFVLEFFEGEVKKTVLVAKQ